MKIGTSRVETFSDGVIAIVITIMVLELKLPDFKREATEWTVQHYLTDAAPYLISYAFSFMMVGIFWTNHHHMFHLFNHIDERIIWQNLLFLFWISLIPLATAMIGTNFRLPSTVAAYAFVMLMTTLSFALMRSYSLKKGLVHKDPNPDTEKKILKVSVRARKKSFAGTAAYLVAIPAAFISPYLSYCCMVIPPVLFFIPDGVDDEAIAEQIIEANEKGGV